MRIDNFLKCNVFQKFISVLSCFLVYITDEGNKSIGIENTVKKVFYKRFLAKVNSDNLFLNHLSFYQK